MLLEELLLLIYVLYQYHIGKQSPPQEGTAAGIGFIREGRAPGPRCPGRAGGGVDRRRARRRPRSP